MPAVYLTSAIDPHSELSLDGCSWLKMTLAVCEQLLFPPSFYPLLTRVLPVVILLMIGSIGSLLYMLGTIVTRLPPPDQDPEARRIRLEEDVQVDERGRPVLAIVTGDGVPITDGQAPVPLRTWNICGGGMAF